jgi:hypothetical protein
MNCSHPPQALATEETGNGVVRWNCLACGTVWYTHTDD